MSQTLPPKSFQQILGDMVEKAISTSTVDELQSGSIVHSLLEQVERTERYFALIKFLIKLDPRFERAMDPWVGVRIAQRYYSRP